MAKIEVVQHQTMNRMFLLRIYFKTRDNRVVRFDSPQCFEKDEADYLAMTLASNNGFKRDRLPTHEYIAPDPKPEDI